MTGAFGHGLKAVATAMHEAGLIGASWPAGVADGLGAQVRILRAARSVHAGTPLAEAPGMEDVCSYNAVDCRAIFEVLDWLRMNR